MSVSLSYPPRSHNQNNSAPSEVLCESPESPLQDPAACSAEMRGWHREVLGFLTPKVFLCTDCHFIGWGYLKSLSWCLSSLLGDTGSPRALCSLWFLLSEVFCFEKINQVVVAAAGSFTSVTRSQDTFQHLGKIFFFPCFFFKNCKIYFMENL